MKLKEFAIFKNNSRDHWGYCEISRTYEIDFTPFIGLIINNQEIKRLVYNTSSKTFEFQGDYAETENPKESAEAFIKCNPEWVIESVYEED